MIDKSKELSKDTTADVVALWRPSYTEPIRPAVNLVLPYDSYFKNNIFDPDVKGSKKVEAGFLQVNPKLRGKGIGERLVRGLGALSQEYDFPEIFVCIASQYSLDILERVFSRERMTFYGLPTSSLVGVTASTPMERLEGVAFETIREILVVLESVEKDPELRDLGFPVTVDMDGLDMSNWSVPLQYGKQSVDLGSL